MAKVKRAEEISRGTAAQRRLKTSGKREIKREKDISSHKWSHAFTAS